MADDEELSSYSYLWDGSDPGWVVATWPGARYGGIPSDRVRGTALIIEDDETYRAVVAMAAHGCPVVPAEGLRHMGDEHATDAEART